MLPPAGVVTDAKVGAEFSSVKVTALPVKVFPSLSVAVARTVYVPSLSEAQVGMVTLLVHAAAVPPLVVPCVVARFATPACQPGPFQWLFAEVRWGGKVGLCVVARLKAAACQAAPVQ